MAEDKYGREIPDQTRIEIPAGLKRPLSIQEEIKRFVRVELSRQAQDQGEETFEESDDFATDEDDELVSPYELDDDPLPTSYPVDTPPAAPAGPERAGGDGQPQTPGAFTPASGEPQPVVGAAPSGAPK